jgi:hypothetical protein
VKVPILGFDPGRDTNDRFPVWDGRAGAFPVTGVLGVLGPEVLTGVLAASSLFSL